MNKFLIWEYFLLATPHWPEGSLSLFSQIYPLSFIALASIVIGVSIDSSNPKDLTPSRRHAFGLV